MSEYMWMSSNVKKAETLCVLQHASSASSKAFWLFTALTHRACEYQWVDMGLSPTQLKLSAIFPPKPEYLFREQIQGLDVINKGWWACNAHMEHRNSSKKKKSLQCRFPFSVIPVLLISTVGMSVLSLKSSYFFIQTYKACQIKQTAHVVRTNSTLHWEHWSFLNFLDNWNVAGILYLPEQFQERGTNCASNWSNKTESAIMGWHMLDMCLHPSAKNKMRKTRNLYSRQDDISKLRLCRIFMLTLAHLVSDITVRVMLALTSGQLNRLQIN